MNSPLGGQLYYTGNTSTWRLIFTYGSLARRALGVTPRRAHSGRLGETLCYHGVYLDKYGSESERKHAQRRGVLEKLHKTLHNCSVRLYMA